MLLFSSLYSLESLYSLSLSFGLQLSVLIALVFGIYYTTFRKKNFVFTFFLIGIIVFFLSFIMSKLELNLGFGLGLFAIFGIIRYRTDLIPIREMTYLFVIIGLSVLNGINTSALSLLEAVLLNATVIIIVFVFEKILDLKTESSKVITFDRLDLLKPGSEIELINELKERTGISFEKVEIIKYNLVKQNALIKAYYHSKKFENGSDSMLSMSDDGDDD
jgi:hypothetical protein